MRRQCVSLCYVREKKDLLLFRKSYRGFWKSIDTNLFVKPICHLWLSVFKQQCVCSEEKADVKRKRQTESERDCKSTDTKMGLTS